MMEDHDYQRFLTGINLLAEVLGDSVTELKLKGFWGIFRDRVTIDEWEYCCLKTMEEQRFHKIPTPAMLMDEVREHRKLVREMEQRPAPSTKEILQLREELISEEERKAFFAKILGDDRLKDPIPPYEQEAP